MSLLHVMDHMLVRAGSVLESATSSTAATGVCAVNGKDDGGAGGRKGSGDGAAAAAAGSSGSGLPEVQLSKSDAKELLNKCGAALKHLLQHAVYSADSYSKVSEGFGVRVSGLGFRVSQS